MILVDTSIWIDHLRNPDEHLAALLQPGLAATHPLVILELRLGSLRNRDGFLGALVRLPRLPEMSAAEVSTLIESRRLWRRGLSVIDVSLAASVLVTPGSSLWTRNRRLKLACEEMSIPLDISP
ncbi:MAG: type II toxin-antitoxin system VapC family toxin [Propionibacteriaceae bacterium]|nr:type II toxin-antitoxin system VapC family toxin [Propionibacteriaceae bacterium]